MSKKIFARGALAQIPKILTLMDRNPHSPTYGCFDRNFWHYKIIDFPSGMAQEFVWPLALAYDTDITDNPFYKKLSIKEWVEAGILFASRSAHKDGSCDDYFPYERASGAAAFSLLACIESYTLLNMENDTALCFFEKRGDWLAKHKESGQLSNHQALTVLCLELLSKLLNTAKWEILKEKRLKTLLNWQSPEGWFLEYEGCDPGYHTLTISLLARLYELKQTPELKDALLKAVKFAEQFIHPDDSYGGEYGSRNTYNFFPHGFELVGKWMSEALRINDHFLIGLSNGLSPCYSDDHIIGHHTWNYLLAYRDFVEERHHSEASRPTGRIWFKEAKILIDRRDDAELYVALNKGGVFKLFRDNRLVASDTQLSLKVENGEIKNAVGHLIDNYKIRITATEIVIEGSLGWAKQKLLTPMNLIAFRFLTIIIGRFFSDIVRKLLQKILITNKKNAPFAFSRLIRWENGRLKIIDELRTNSWNNVVAAGIGCDQTSIYNVMSRTFQIGQLQPWFDLIDEVKKLSPGQPLRLERNL
jgi:hypothetical protein